MREPDPDAGEQLRRRGRQMTRKKIGGAAGAHVLRRPDQDLVDRQHGVARRDEHRKEAPEKAMMLILRGVPEAEQQQEDRQERDLRDRNRGTRPADRRNAARRNEIPAPRPTMTPAPAPRAKPASSAIEAGREAARQLAGRRSAPTIAARIAVGARQIGRQHAGAAEQLPTPPAGRPVRSSFWTATRDSITLPPGRAP